jgi:excinuclease ABC subunit C
MSEIHPTAFDAKAFLRGLPHSPGVYRMLSGDGLLLYVGKAGNLKKRVSSYFQKQHPNTRIRSMVSQIRDIEITVTNTEAEALILENNLIKEHRPRYNVLLRDDKSYPYIFVSTRDQFPRLGFHRGARRKGGKYFGPYPSVGAVRDTLNLLQKLFRVRQCEDSFFRNRSRPCLQYQIGRCTAPCVGLISTEEYGHDIDHALRFLEGKNDEIIHDLVERMEEASERLDYERAAAYRDQIHNLRKITDKQHVSGTEQNVDVLVCVQLSGLVCVQAFTIRSGNILGNKNFFPGHTEGMSESEVLEAFIGQYYQTRDLPDEMLLSHELEDRELLQKIFTERKGRKVSLTARVRGDRARWLDLARRNAEQALKARLSSRAGMQQRFEALQDELGLSEQPARLECFDISHTQGEATVASCVVFNEEGPLKSDYRRFNIEGIEPGDDYAAMRQALTRRYTRIKKGEGRLPDILFIDGGKGQVRQAVEVLEELQVEGVTIIGVAKGEGRKPGLESLILSDQPEPTILPPDSMALHLIQHIRDEAHRFAITGHRQRRAKARRSSPLEEIPGLGPKRRQTLLKHFGGIQGVSQASSGELAKIPGISEKLAQNIYDVFHEK